jgi:hypothetical protein
VTCQDCNCRQGRDCPGSLAASRAALGLPPLDEDKPLLEPFEVPPLPRYFIVAFVAVMAFALIVASGGIDGWLQQLAAARR